VLSFAFLVVILGLGLFLKIRHGQALPEDREAVRPMPRAGYSPTGSLLTGGAIAGMYSSEGYQLPQEHCWTSQQWHPSISDPTADVHQAVAADESSLAGGTS
jgi:hypothetical protein